MSQSDISYSEIFSLLEFGPQKILCTAVVGMPVLGPERLDNGEPERAEMGAKRPISQRVYENVIYKVF